MKASAHSVTVHFVALLLGASACLAQSVTPPFIVTQPASRSVNAGQPATFSIVATGSPSYQWRKNGVPIPAATGSTLTIANPGPLDAVGAYTVTASNNVGSVTSAPATLTVNGMVLAVTTQPANVSVNIGSPAVFTATVVATPAARFQWQRNGVAIAGATSNSYTIPAVTAADAGTYALVVSNTLDGLTSAPATLTVLLPRPIIIAQPEATGVNAGDGTARFTVDATDGTNFQWQKNGTNVTNGGPYSGATTPTLTVTNPDHSAAGEYRALVSNNSGSATSNPAGLTVFPVRVPTIATQPQSVTASLGSSVSFTVVPNPTGAPSFTYQWRRDGVPLANGNTDTFTIARVTAGDVGSYTVVVGNNPPDPATTVTSLPATLALSAAPVITTQPASATRTEGQSVSFTVAASGTPAPTYQWFKDTTAIAGATTATYSIPSVTLPDAAGYSVLVSNSGGSVRSAPATLVVNTAPVVSQPRGRLSNLSVLTAVSPADPSFIVGTVVGGAGTRGTKAVLVRAGGPSLVPLGVGDAVSDPTLTLVQGPTTMVNDDWAGAPALQAAFARVGAFGYVSPGSKDAALLVPALAIGNTTVEVSGVGNASGSVIAEIYDATPPDALGEGVPRLINVSVRKRVQAGTTLTAGFVIAGGPRTVLVRAVGPTLTAFSVPGVMDDPQIVLNRRGTAFSTNDNWAGDATLAAVFGQVGAFTLPAASRDAAMVATLEPGEYTAVVSGVGGTGGTALIEVYEVP